MVRAMLITDAQVGWYGEHEALQWECRSTEAWMMRDKSMTIYWCTSRMVWIECRGTTNATAGISMAEAEEGRETQHHGTSSWATSGRWCPHWQAHSPMHETDSWGSWRPTKEDTHRKTVCRRGKIMFAVRHGGLAHLAIILLRHLEWNPLAQAAGLAQAEATARKCNQSSDARSHPADIHPHGQHHSSVRRTLPLPELQCKTSTVIMSMVMLRLD